MDKQKTLPPLTQKITRKLASESADHHNVMKFYSQISRDETGAPKKWKMSNPVQITEGMISNVGTSKSREGSTERKKSANKAINSVKKRAASKDSPDRASTRESSLESKDKNIKENRGRKSLSADTRARAENSLENGVKSETESRRRNRPKSLDLSNKALTNGDEDSFRSPHPLTPCNVAVKRRKGRPKETPPTLVAESPVEAANDETEIQDINMEQDTEKVPVVPRRKGRRTNTKIEVNANKLKKPLALKTVDKSAKTLGSKIIKKTILKSLKKLPKVKSDAKPVTETNDLLDESVDEQKQDSDLLSPRRKPGRPLGARNKPKQSSPEPSEPEPDDKVTETVIESPIPPPDKKKGDKVPLGVRNKPKQSSPEPSEPETDYKVTETVIESTISPPDKKKGGRPPGARNRTSIGFSPRRNKAKSLNKVSSENSAGDKIKDQKAVTKSTSETVDNEAEMPSEVLTDDPIAMDTSNEPKIEADKIEEAVEEVILKADERKTVNLPAKKQSTLHTAHFKSKRGIKSLGKLKKETTSVPRVKKKRVLMSHATNSDAMTSLAHLPANDLRRKLQRNLIEKLNGKRTKTLINSVDNEFEASEVQDQNETSEIKEETQSVSLEISDNIDKQSNTGEDVQNLQVETENVIEKDIDADIQNLSALVEQKRVNKSEPDLVPEQKKRLGRQRKSNSEQRDLSKFSDSESVCSELSTQSLGSLRKSQEKQVYVLGEENMDSDDNTVRTRQRFEIIPGKKRKRTLSGEFDLLDEVQLRKKQKKVAEQEDPYADESDTQPYEESKFDAKRKSPKVKKTILMAKRLQVNKSRKSYRERMLKQSPFLNIGKKKHAYNKKRKLSRSSSDTEVGGFEIENNESVDQDIKELELSSDTVMHTETKVDDVFEDLGKHECDIKESTPEPKTVLEQDSELGAENVDSFGINEETKEQKEVELSLSLEIEEETTEIEPEEIHNDTEIESKINGQSEISEKSETEEAKVEAKATVEDESKVKIEEKLEVEAEPEVEPKPEIELETDIEPEIESETLLETECIVEGAVKESLVIKESLETNECVIKDLLAELVDNVLALKSNSHENLLDKEIVVSKETDNQNIVNEGVKSLKCDTLEIQETETAAMIQTTEQTLSESAGIYPDGIARTPVAVRGNRGRRRRGRRPYKHLMHNNRALHSAAVMHKKIPSRRARKVSTRGAHKISPDGGGLTRTFELRQKISRSPLDNIAMKQSIEESEYYKNEAQKAVRKELKRAKRLSPSQEADVVPAETSTTEPTETYSNDNEEMSAEETESRTEMLLRECKPCSVLLTDFYRQLQLARRRVDAEDDTENDTEESLSDGSPLHVPEIHDQSYDEDFNYMSDIIEAEESTSIQTDQIDNQSSQKSDKEIPLEDIKEATVVETDSDKLKSEQMTGSNNEEMKNKDLSLLENQTSAVDKPVKSRTSKSSIKAKKSIPKSSDFQYRQNFEAQITSQIEDIPKIAMHKPGPKSRRTSRKSVPSGSGRGRKPRHVSPSEIIPETQTARKTVPPLKIKLKGGLKSRRKTYMVETIIDDQANFKVVKKRSKSKSGSRSESETEKVSKSHHHHQKRKSRTPDVEKKNKHAPQVAPVVPEKTPEKKPPKPTDAYEANFLQFIQNSQDQQSKPSSYYGNVNTKGKPLRQLSKGKAYKVDADGSLTVTASASSLAETTTSTNTEKVVLSSNTEVTNTVVSVNDSIENNSSKNDAKELQFVCSYCDKMVFREKDYIVKHIKEMHPGEDIVYKEMPYIITDSHIEYIGEKEQAGQSENIFDRMSDLYSADSDTTGMKVPDKTSAEADSTTEVESSAAASTSADKKQSGMETVVQPEPLVEADDESSGSLNLKIVEVVSLKDHVGLLDTEDAAGASSHEPTKPTDSVIIPAQIPKSTELRVPQYPSPMISPKVPVQNQINSDKNYVETAKKSAQHNVDVTMKKINQNITGGKTVCSFKCRKCNVHAPMLAAMVAHLRNSHKEIARLFQCPYCRDMEAESESKIHEHIRRFHPTDNPNPPVALSEPAKRHLATIQVKLPVNMKPSDGHALEKDIYMCLNCGTHKPSLETIYEHLEEEHSDVFVYVCPVCKTFKSKHESVVNNHLVHIHQQMFRDVNLSLAIDGNQFTRVTCLLKDKNKIQKSSSSSSTNQSKSQSSVHGTQPNPHSVQQKQHQQQTSVVARPQQQTVSPVASLYQRLYQSSQHTTSTGSTASHSPQSPLTPLTVNTNSSSSAAQPQKPSPQVRPPSAPAPKRKKNLLESIEQLTLQKQREQQGLLQPTSKGTTSSSDVPASSVSSQPPPLLRGPPPLIRYDQLDKAPPSYSAAMASLAARVPGAASGQSSLAGRTKSPSVAQSQIPPRPIQSSLFDTSDPETFKPVKRSPVLNVPVVPRSKYSTGLASKSPSPQKQTTSSGAAPLDLSKTTPSPSPQPAKMMTPPPVSLANVAKTSSKPRQVTPEGINPDIFKVFNLKPTSSAPQPTIRPSGTIMQASLSPLVAAQHILPQQVRPNTSSTLAYRPAIPHVSATAQVPQLMNMGAIIGNIMVPITSLPQNLQPVQGMGQMTQIPGLPTQLVHMSVPQPLLTQALPINAAQVSTPVVVQSKASALAANNAGHTGSQPLSNLNLPMFKCPYCPKVIPLTLAQVQPHIETQHPGSSIVFTQLENK